MCGESSLGPVMFVLPLGYSLGGRVRIQSWEQLGPSPDLGQQHTVAASKITPGEHGREAPWALDEPWDDVGTYGAGRGRGLSTKIVRHSEERSAENRRAVPQQSKKLKVQYVNIGEGLKAEKVLLLHMVLHMAG